MRTPLVIGNWKLNGSKAMVKAVISELQSALVTNSQCQVAIAPPVMYLAQAQQLLRDQQAAAGTPILLAAQNVDSHSIGAFTGDISANMLQEFDVKLVIIGHSERRCYHQENNATIVKKFALLQSVGLMPVLCIGESEAERAMGATESVCTAQLSTVIQTLGAGAFKQAVIAYEPIWAIGSGQSASPEQAQQVHHFIRSYLAQGDAETAAKVRILYGGSVNASNAGQLFAMPDIDGALVGGAALNAHTFASIIHQMSESGQLS